MNKEQMTAALDEARRVHAERVAELHRRVQHESDEQRKLEMVKMLLRLKSLSRPSLRVPRGFQAYAEHGQVHAGGGSFKELRLTLFIATHADGKAYFDYSKEDQTHACHFLFDCCLYEKGLRAVFFYRHLSPDAYAHYKHTAESRSLILRKFMEEVSAAELAAFAAGKPYVEPDAELVLKYAKQLFKDSWGNNAATSEVPPWVPAAVRGR